MRFEGCSVGRGLKILEVLFLSAIFVQLTTGTPPDPDQWTQLSRWGFKILDFSHCSSFLLAVPAERQMTGTPPDRSCLLANSSRNFTLVFWHLFFTYDLSDFRPQGDLLRLGLQQWAPDTLPFKLWNKNSIENSTKIFKQKFTRFRIFHVTEIVRQYSQLQIQIVCSSNIESIRP